MGWDLSCLSSERKGFGSRQPHIDTEDSLQSSHCGSRSSGPNSAERDDEVRLSEPEAKRKNKTVFHPMTKNDFRDHYNITPFRQRCPITYEVESMGGLLGTVRWDEVQRSSPMGTSNLEGGKEYLSSSSGWPTWTIVSVSNICFQIRMFDLDWILSYFNEIRTSWELYHPKLLVNSLYGPRRGIFCFVFETDKKK
ncbi:hypothetical protein J6590_034676 [Homalodisca vitripennis]|nr:hypothetical protein J6590_034676 [Homalodisca vitripennis]